MHKGDHHLSILMQSPGCESQAIFFINDQHIFADMNISMRQPLCLFYQMHRASESTIINAQNRYQ